MAAVFHANKEQWALAQETGRRHLAGKTVTLRTPILPLSTFYRAEDYHQKYYLRRHADLVREFSGYGEQQFTDSTVAARLNAYVSGHGTPEALEAEFAHFGLSEAGGKRLRELAAAALTRRRR